MTNRTLRYIILTITFVSTVLVHATNWRKIGTRDGLTNSAVLSLCQDADGVLWIGTCDGLNIYDGHTVYPAIERPDMAAVTGNIIESINASVPGTIWVQTNYGLNKVEQNSGEYIFFPQYQGQDKVRVDAAGTVYLLDSHNRLRYYPADSHADSFIDIGDLDVPFSNVLEFVMSPGAMRIFTNDAIVDYKLENKDGKLSLGSKHTSPVGRLKHVFNDNINSTLAIDDRGRVLEFRSLDTEPVVLADISDEIRSRGNVSDMLADSKGNIYVSFYTDDIIKLNKGIDGSYSVSSLGLGVGVFGLEKAKNQNIIWAATDCHGVYTIFDGPFTIQSVEFADMANKLSKPVRALYLDSDRNLWIGSKGDGILQVRDFNIAQAASSFGNTTLFTTANSSLSDNSVYAFAASSRPLLWIGGDGGVDYYSYKDKQIHHLDLQGQSIREIHSVFEVDASTLYITASGRGVYELTIGGTPDRPQVTDMKLYSLNNGNFSSNFFFSQTTDREGPQIFSNRGMGAYMIDGDSLRSVVDLSHYDAKTIKDIFDVERYKDVLWLGTGHGLLKAGPDEQTLYFGSEKGFLNSTIHSLLMDKQEHLWISTNQGLVRFDPVTESAEVFAGNYGLTVTEFSDRAAVATPDALLFGGVNGIVVVSSNPFYTRPEQYMPSINLVNLSVAGHAVPLHAYLNQKDGQVPQIRLGSDQNYFSVSFLMPDYLSPENYTFFYSLDGKNWIDNGSSSTINFTGMHYGLTPLYVKYYSHSTDIESDVYRFDIVIATPWYLSTWAKTIYILAVMALMYWIFRRYQLRQKDRQARAIDQLQRAHKEEMYESKLRFFTNITHEFCTPLTLIFGSCERILSWDEADEYMRKYVSLIQSNTKRLNSLIQDLIDFRRIETGHRVRVIRPVDVSEVGNDIYRSFGVIAEQNGVHFKSDIAQGIRFNTDYKALLRIMSNLLSNAFKYTPVDGTVRLAMNMDGDKLQIKVFNTGKGISDADKKKIFNRYSILDNVEENATRGISSRNGLGMAILSSLVEMLEGNVDIDSEIGKNATFTVNLPPLACDENVDESSAPAADLSGLPQLPQADPADATAPVVREFSRSQQTLLVIDDNRDILTLLSDSLSEYNIITAGNAADGLEALKNNSIDLIITDVMMPGIDGMTLTRQLKTNKDTMYIPLIILSAKNTDAEKTEGIAAGADAYVGKPFHLSYLRAVIVRLLENRIQMREYFNTSASAFEYSQGQLIDKESKDFIDKVIDFVDSNIDNSELSTEQLADNMQMSVRNLYRRFKELDLPSPNDFIKQHRINFAAKLLVTTSLTVQEIIYRCGFNNRSHFYREFDKIFGMTPKEYRSSNKTKSDLDSTADK